MKQIKRLTVSNLVVVLGVAALLAAAPAASASGSYTSRPPMPRSERKSQERALYALGQKVFDDKVKLEAQSDPAKQRDRLAGLQSRLPERVAKKKDLNTLAGRLSPEQLEALEYYVNQRFAK